MSISRVADRVLDPASFQGPGELEIAAKLVDKDGRLTLKALQKAYAKANDNDPAHATVLKRMLQAAANPRPAGTFANQAALRAEPEAVTTAKTAEATEAALPEDVVKFRKDLDAFIKGQEPAKEAATRFYRKIRTGLSQKPTIALLPGPPGVGKTLTASAIAYALTGNPNAYVTFDCAELGDESALKKHFGVSAGYANHEESKKTATFSPDAVAQKVPGNAPVVILIDEIDKIADPVLRAQVANKFNRFFETGVMPLENGLELDLRGRKVVVLITSNSGADDAGNKQGEELDAHFRQAAEASVASHINSRLDAVIPFRPLTPEIAQDIAGAELRALFNRAQAMAQRESDKAVRFEASGAVAKLLADLATSNIKLGARPMKSAVDQLMSVKVAEVVATAEDESRYIAVLRKDASRVLRDLQKEFAKTDGKVPATLTPEDFPVDIVLKNPPPVVTAYEGRVPVSDWARMIPYASGVVGGRGYLLANNGEIDAPNELFTLRTGATETLDEFIRVPLPDSLANANLALYGVTIDEARSSEARGEPNRRALFLGVNCPNQGEAEQSAYIYDPVSNRKKPFIEVKPPPVPLFGATLASVGGEVLLWGGRLVERKDAAWGHMLDLAETVGEPFVNQVFKLDLSTGEWSELPTRPSEGRGKAAHVVVGDKLWIIGGVERAFTAQGAAYWRSSQQVDIYDPATGTFSPGPKLPYGVAEARASIDEFGRVEVALGSELTNNGFESYQHDAVLRFDPNQENAQWRVRRRLPLSGVDLQRIPHPRGGEILGPLFATDPTTGEVVTQFLIEKPQSLQG